MAADGFITTDWNRADRPEVLGLHLLHMSARRDWIVRHDLTIDLVTSAYAVQHYEVDIDRDRVDEVLPAGLIRDRDNLIWLPVLRIPSIRSADQRVTGVVRTVNRSLPLMPQSRVRRYLGAGLAWLLINRMPRLQDATTTQQALIRNGLRRCVRSYLAKGRGGLCDEMTALRQDRRTLLRSGDPASSIVNWDWIESLFDHRSPTDDPYSAGVSECIAYARLGYLAVVGIEVGERYPHVALDLLPADLELTRYNGIRDARQLLGFEPPDDPRFHSVRRRPWYLPKVAISRWASPSLYHLEVPLPEIGDLEGVHVQITTPEEVSLSPAVLHHDHRIDRADGPRQIIQSRTRAGQEVPSPLELIARTLPPNSSSLAHRSNRRILIDELRPVATAWNRRILRVDAVERLARPTPRRRLHHRMLQPWARSWRRTRARATPPRPVPPAERSAISRRTNQMSRETATLIDYLERPEVPTETTRTLDRLVAIERTIPHLEMSGDDDLRDHVAHFHADNGETVFHQATDSRPVVNAILRASTQGRKGSLTLAASACLTSTVLLGVLLVMALIEVSAFNAEAIVALLLLVPGISVSLVGRVPGDSLVHLVLGRSQRLMVWSLVPPVVTAAILATLFGEPTPGGSDAGPAAVPLGWLPDLTILRLLASMFALSLLPTLGAWWDALAHRDDFNWDAQVLGRLAYRDEVDPALGERPEHDETTTATVDSTKVAEVIAPALFQISRPHQRFMVVVTHRRDTPNAYQDAVQVLEDLPALLDGRQAADRTGAHDGGDPAGTPEPAEPASPAEAGPDQAVVESSLVTSVATTGMTMSIVSTDLSQGAPPIRSDHIEREVERALAETESHHQVDVDVRAIEIADDTSYFRYRSVRHRHYAFTGREGPDGPTPLARADRQKLLDDILALETDRRRIAYLYLPIRPDPEGKDEAIRVGFATSDDWEPDDQNLSLLLVELAQRNSVSVATDRTVADEPGRGTDYDWPEMGRQGLRPFMILSAGENHREDLEAAVTAISNSPHLHLEGGTVLTDGGYTSRMLRIWGDEEGTAELCRSLNQQAAGRSPAATGTGWYHLPSSTSDMMALQANRPDHTATAEVEPTGRGDGEWVFAWLRWRLDTSSGGTTTLLAGMDTWRTEAGDDAWSPTFINVEFLSSRSDSRLSTGKARCRIGIASTTADAASLADRVRRSLEAGLHAHLGDHLANSRRYLVVEPHEPPDPLELLPESNGFDPDRLLDQMRPSSATASRSDTSSAADASILVRLKSLMSRP